MHYILVDASGYLFRAYHALPPLTTKAGHPTGATRGMATMLLLLLEQHPESQIVMVFDAKGKSFRSELYPEYKAQRPPMPDDMRAQIYDVHELVRALGFPLLAIEGVEADDTIATLARQLGAIDTDVLIISGDKDLTQLVGGRVQMHDSLGGKQYDREAVTTKFGVPPELIADYLALVGDKADNVPGVPKVGPKTAVKWLQQYGDLEGIVAHQDDIGGNVGNQLRAHLEQLRLSRQLVDLRYDVAVPALEELRMQPRATEQLRELFTRLEFNSLLARLDTEPTPAATAPEVDYSLVLQADQLQQVLEQLSASERIVLDLETDSLDSMRARVVGIALSIAEHQGWYIPLGHTYPDCPQQLDLEAILAALEPILHDSSKTIIFQNAKYDLHVLANHGVEVRAAIADTMLASYVLDSTQKHDFDSLALRELNRQTIKFSEVAGKGADANFATVELEAALAYACEDADLTGQLEALFQPRLQAEPVLESVYQNIELPLVRVLLALERNGAYVDRDLLEQQGMRLRAELTMLEQEIYQQAGSSFNLNSPKQLQVILYDQLQLPVLKKTAKGDRSTNEFALQDLARLHPLPKLILRYRGLAKLLNTYIDKLPEQINPSTGRVHGSLHQAVASTGRLSSSDPNLQNIPIRNRAGRDIRKAFSAAAGKVILSCDYSQVELRIMAHLSQDVGLISAFQQDKDIHQATASEVFATPLEEVSSEQRRRSKAINFGLIYGMGAFGLSKQLNISRDEAADYIQLYFERYPGVQRFMQQTRAQAHDSGYVETICGRRLYLAEINSSNGQRRAAAERMAINAPMQGSAADIIKLAMINIQAFMGEFPGALMVLQVHDELVFEVPETLLEPFQKRVIAAMSSAQELSVPLKVDTGVGPNWNEAH